MEKGDFKLIFQKSPVTEADTFQAVSIASAAAEKDVILHIVAPLKKYRSLPSSSHLSIWMDITLQTKSGFFLKSCKGNNQQLCLLFCQITKKQLSQNFSLCLQN